MIVSVERFRAFVTTDLADDVLADKLSAIEAMVRKATNNNFQDRGRRTYADIIGGKLVMDNTSLFFVGDTMQISESIYNDRLVVLRNIDGSTDETLVDEEGVLVTKVSYPMDIVMGAVNLCKWDLENRNKVGVKSESISRWNVTYFDMDANSKLGYPTSLVDFMKPYKKARF